MVDTTNDKKPLKTKCQCLYCKSESELEIDDEDWIWIECKFCGFKLRTFNPNHNPVNLIETHLSETIPISRDTLKCWLNLASEENTNHKDFLRS